MFEVNGALLVHSLEAVETNEFRAHFNINGLHVKQLLK